MKKYEFTGETINFMGRTLHRIKACRDFGSAKAGDIGGFIEKEENLSHCGNAWVFEDAKVFEDALIKDPLDYFVIGPIGSRGDFTTFYKTTTGIGVVCGCFKGSIEEFEDAVKKTHGDNEHAQDYRMVICIAKNRLRKDDATND